MYISAANNFKNSALAHRNKLNLTKDNGNGSPGAITKAVPAFVAAAMLSSLVPTSASAAAPTRSQTLADTTDRPAIYGEADVNKTASKTNKTTSYVIDGSKYTVTPLDSKGLEEFLNPKRKSNAEIQLYSTVSRSGATLVGSGTGASVVQLSQPIPTSTQHAQNASVKISSDREEISNYALSQNKARLRSIAQGLYNDSVDKACKLGMISMPVATGGGALVVGGTANLVTAGISAAKTAAATAAAGAAKTSLLAGGATTGAAVVSSPVLGTALVIVGATATGVMAYQVASTIKDINNAKYLYSMGAKDPTDTLGDVDLGLFAGLIENVAGDWGKHTLPSEEKRAQKAEELFGTSNFTDVALFKPAKNGHGEYSSSEMTLVVADTDISKFTTENQSYNEATPEYKGFEKTIINFPRQYEKLATTLTGQDGAKMSSSQVNGTVKILQAVSKTKDGDYNDFVNIFGIAGNNEVNTMPLYLGQVLSFPDKKEEYDSITSPSFNWSTDSLRRKRGLNYSQSSTITNLFDFTCDDDSKDDPVNDDDKRKLISVGLDIPKARFSALPGNLNTDKYRVLEAGIEGFAEYNQYSRMQVQASDKAAGGSRNMEKLQGYLGLNA